MADEQRQILIDVEVENKDFDKEIGNVNKELEENKKLIRELKKDYSANSTEIAKLEARNRKLSKSKRQLIKESETESNSLAALRLRLAKLTNERNNLDTSLESNARRFQELQKEIKQTSDEIKGFEEEGGDFRRNVGNYVEQIDVFGVSLGELTTKFGLLAAGVGAAVAAVGGLFKAYVSSARGAEDLARATDRLDSIMVQLGNTIADVFGGDDGEPSILEQALFAAQVQLLGISSTIKSNVVVSVRAALRELSVLEIEQQRNAKQQLDRAEQLRQIRDEERNSIEDRRAANEELLKVINEREEDAIAFQEKRLEQLKTLLAFDKGNLELQREIKQVEFEIADIREESQGFRSEQLANDLALSKEVNENLLALEQERIRGQLQATEEGTEERLNLQRRLVQITKQIELRSAGENAQLRELALQKAINDEKALLVEYEKFKQELREKDLEDFRNYLQKIVEAENERFKRSFEARAELLIFEQEQLGNLERAEIARRNLLLQSQELTEDERQLIIAQSEARITDIRRRRSEEQVQIEKDKADLIRQQNEQLFGILGGLFEQGTIAAKVAGLAQIAYSTGTAVARGISAAQSVPFPGNIAAIGTTLAQIYAGISQARKLFAEGDGEAPSTPLSASAPTSASVPSGLANVNATLLSQFGDQARNDQQNTQDVVNGVSNLPPIFVSVEEINRGQSRLETKVKEANLG